MLSRRGRVCATLSGEERDLSRTSWFFGALYRWHPCCMVTHMTDEKKDLGRDHHKELRRVRELLREFRSGMFVTRDYEGAVHSRPMLIAEVDDEARLSFLTQLQADKVEEVMREPQVGITLQSPGAFVAISGTARVILDVEEKRRIWCKATELWFEGPEDPFAGVIQVVPERLEYWDNRGMNNLKLAVQALLARAQGKRLRLDSSQHGYVRLGPPDMTKVA